MATAPTASAATAAAAGGDVSYRGCVMAAPMVRISTLSFRLFAAQCGADVVFSEELVAAKLAKCIREEVPLPAAALLPEGDANDDGATGWDADARHVVRRLCGGRPAVVVQFVVYESHRNTTKRSVVASTLRVRAPDGSLVSAEGTRFIFQMGVADPAVGAKAAALVCNDCDGLDINMGCPKKFSVDQGMGAALMSDPERGAAIIRAIREAIGPTKPFSFKTRVFDDVEASVRQLTTCLAVGSAHSLTLHARTRDQRSETPPKYDVASAVVARLRERFPDVCYVLNGSMGCSGLHHSNSPAPQVPASWGGKAEMLAEAKQRGFDGVLVARDAMWNPTVFLPLPAADDAAAAAAGRCYCPDYAAVHRAYMTYNAVFATPLAYVKYHLTRTWQELQYHGHKPRYTQLVRAKSLVDYCAALGIDAGTTARFVTWHEAQAAVDGVVPPGRELPPPGDGMKRQASSSTAAATTSAAGEGDAACAEKKHRADGE